MKLSDIANLVPGAKVDHTNPIRAAIKTKRTKDLKFALRQKTRNNPLADTDPPVKTGSDMTCLLYTSPSPRDRTRSRMPSSA